MVELARNMAIEDTSKKGLSVTGNSAPAKILHFKREGYRVEISTVRDVRNADWRKAHEVAEIVSRANLSPHLVTNALILGHNYPGEALILEDVPINLEENKVGEVGLAGDNVISWRIEEAKQSLIEGGKSYVRSDENSLVVAERLPDVISDTSPAKVIRMAVIIKEEEVVVPQIEEPKEEQKTFTLGPLDLDKAA